MLLFLFILANLGIFAGYVFAATAVAPRLKVKLRRTKFGGVLFFLSCGMTHLEMALHAGTKSALDEGEFTSYHMLIIHVVQLVAVWLFLTGLYKELTVGGLDLRRRGR